MNNILLPKHIFIHAPHFDDAFISLGGYLAFDKKIKKTISVYFAKTQNIKAIHSKNEDTELASKIREIEEYENVQKISGKLLTFDNSEALLRGHVRSLSCGYPNIFDIRIDSSCYLNVYEEVKSNIVNNLDAIHLFPLAIGQHSDHILINKCAKKILNDNSLSKDLLIGFYEDLPYVCSNNVSKSLFIQFLPLMLPTDIERKIEFIRNYKSQSICKHLEAIINYMRSINKHDDSYNERIWLPQIVLNKLTSI